MLAAPMARTLLAFLVLFSSLAAGVQAQDAPRSASAAPELTARVHSQVVDARDQRVDTFAQAFDLLMDYFVFPVASDALLAAAWDGLAAEAERREAPDPGAAPPLSGDRATDLASFRAAFTSYLLAHPALPEGFNPTYAAIRGMTAYMDEGHTHFLDPRQFEEHLAWTRGDVRYGGIGARMRGPELTVTEVFEGSPAQRAGLKPGDRILAVNGESTEGVPLEQTVGMIRGPEGTSVELVVLRGETISTISIVREQISIAFVSYRYLEGEFGYISLRGFPEPSVVDQIERHMAEFLEEGIRGLVLDLRGNGGGRIDVGSRLLSHFLPVGSPLFQQVDRSGEQHSRAARQSVLYDLPLVVLVDENTASMGEIFAAAMQEHGKAGVIGTVTAGNVAAGQVFPLGDGSAVQVTVMEIRSAFGRTLNSQGVTPDEIVETDLVALEAGQDPVLAHAIALLRAATEAHAPPPLPATMGANVPISW